MAKRMMKMGVSMHVLGYHAASWRLPDVPADGLMQLAHFAEVMQIAERGLLDMAFLADHGASRNLMIPELLRELHHNNVKHEPLMLLSALATMTSHIGLVSTVCSTYNEPYTIARMLASIDHISNGRAGWNFVTGFCSDEARNYGYDALPPQPFRKARGAEFLEIVHRLFDSWEDDAMVRDKESGIFFDRQKVHAIDFEGEHLNVRGPLDICRPVQGLLPLVMAGDSDSTRELAAKQADVLYAIKADYSLAYEYYGSVKARMPQYGRPADALKIMPGMMIFVGETESDARAKFDQITEATDIRVGLSQMLPIWGDLSHMDLDGPAPELTVGTALEAKGVRHNSGGANTGPGLDFAVAKINREVKSRNLTLRQLAKLTPGAGLWEKTIVGTPAQIADEMEYWFLHGAADGFNLQPPYMPGALRDFVDLVVPELQRRGLYRTEYEGTTLRENLGLARPVSRYADA